VWDVLVTTHDETGRRVSEVLGSYGPAELPDAVAEACHRAGEIRGGIQVVRHSERTRGAGPTEPARVA
jgi:hypothetical protein